MSDLRTIVYVSTATRELTTAELEGLLIAARAFNREHGITGVLLSRGSSFMQCFEGAPADVDAVYERIKRSRHHRDIIEYMDRPVDARAFDAWEMGLAEATASEMLTLSTAAWSRASAQKFSADSPVGLELLKVFWSVRQDVH